jgi:hypothetical protein
MGEGVDLDELVSRVGGVPPLAIDKEALGEPAPTGELSALHIRLHTDAVTGKVRRASRIAPGHRYSNSQINPQRRQARTAIP